MMTLYEFSPTRSIPASEVGLLEDLPALGDYMERMYRRPSAPPRIAAAMASIRG